MKGILVQNSDKHFNYKMNSALRYRIVSEGGTGNLNIKLSEAFSLGKHFRNIGENALASR